MKKFLLTTAAILLLLLVCFAGYVQYKKWKSFNTPIHKDATTLIRINVYSIIQQVLPDYIAPEKGGDGKDLPGKKDEDGWGLELPANVFIYPVVGKAQGTFFTTLALSDEADFKASLKRKLKIFSTDTSKPAYTLIVHELGGGRKLHIAWNHKLAACAFTQTDTEVRDVLDDLLLGRHVIAVSESRFRKIKSLPGDIVYLDDLHSGSINFRKGAIVAEALLQLPGVKPQTGTAHVAAGSGGDAVAWLNADLSALLVGKVFSIGPHTIAADSLLRYYGHAAQLYVHGTTTQQEQTITYSYNDNFEKEEQVAWRTANVPAMQLSVKATPQLLRYLSRQGIINSDSNTVSRSAFPAWQLYVKSVGDGFVLSTFKDKLPPVPAQVTDAYFAGLHANFSLLETIPQLSILKPLSYLDIRASVVGDRRMKISLTLAFDDRQRNALTTLIKH